MIRYRIEIPRALRDLIRHLPPWVKAKVKATLRSIADDRAKDLKDELAGLRSYRIGGVPSHISRRGFSGANCCARPRPDIYERAATELSKTLRKANLIDEFVRARCRLERNKCMKESGR